MKAHFIGNGKSQNLFNAHYGTVVMGNVPKMNISYTALSIIDTKVILYLHNNNIHLENKNIWCTPDIKKQANNYKIQGIWHAIYKPKPKFNSGHQAVQHLSKDFKLIHLWGMDSMFTDDLTSLMDDRVTRTTRPPLNNDWRPYWKQLFSQHEQVLYTIHAPKGTKQIDYGKNCRYEFH